MRPLTQLELRRVHPDWAAYADEALRETVRRLLGSRKGLNALAVSFDATNAAQAAAWMQTGRYLVGRIQGTAEQKLGRTPDMAAAAAEATRAVLMEVGSGRGADSGRGAEGRL